MIKSTTGLRVAQEITRVRSSASPILIPNTLSRALSGSLQKTDEATCQNEYAWVDQAQEIALFFPSLQEGRSSSGCLLDRWERNLEWQK